MNTPIKKELDQYSGILNSNLVNNSIYSSYFTLKLSSSTPRFVHCFVKSEAAVSYFFGLKPDQQDLSDEQGQA